MDAWPESGNVGRPATRWLAMLDDVGTPFAELLPAGMREPFAAAVCVKVLAAPKLTRPGWSCEEDQG
ncbi:MAG: hypothetical protein IT457_19365 [Planctomycetes bacterium]|nr:hypothetical protein [Planctomycetota bacterium]